MRDRFFAAIFLTGCLCSTAFPAAVTFQFNYDFDATGFLDDPVAREIVELAADSVLRWRDNLDAIIPNPDTGDTWTAFTFFTPAGTPGQFVDLVVPADKIVIFIGGASLGVNNSLALTYPGDAFNIFGSTEWEETVETRGQSGAGLGPLVEDTDFGPWGASVILNTDWDWHFGKSVDGLAGKMDLLSVVMHELAHVLGVGPAESWQDRIVDGKFTGTVAVSVGSPTNPDLVLHDGGHFLADTESFVAGVLQTAAMDPFFDLGERKLFTQLDFAALQDIGWDVAAPGDTDRDGDVDSVDIQSILAADSFGNGVGFGWSAGDFDGNLIVDSADIQLIIAGGLFETGPYASQPSPGSPTSSLLVSLAGAGPSRSSAGTPEPSGLALLVIGAAGLAWTALFRRRRACRPR